MSQHDCPDRETLGLLLLGKLPGVSGELLEEHLLHCDVCARVAETIHGTDDVTVAFASQQRLHGDEQILAQVIERGKRILSEIETVQTRETLVVGQQGQEQQVSVPTEPLATPKSLGEEIDFLTPPEQSDEIGRLGGYRVFEVVGVGGMGIVFRAEDPKLKRLVALKAMKPAVAASKTARDRFLREAQSAASIEHDNIVTIHQVGEDRGIPFIAMQFLKGGSLQARLEREERLDQREILRIGREVADGLAAAHKRDLIHRDIKPANIWLEEETRRVKILDFGLARSAKGDEGITQSGMVIGTPRYMAPEQARGEHVDHRCDLFSLGTVLYHLATGKAPFDRRNLTATLLAVAESDPEPIELICPDVHPDLARLIMRLLKKERDQRPQSAAEVSHAIIDVERGLNAERAAQQLLAETTAPTESHVAKPQLKSLKLIFLGGAVVAALALFFILRAAGITFKVETPGGTILVEIDSADKPVAVDVAEDKTVTITDPNDGKEIKITIDRDKKLLKLDKQGFQLAVKSFSLAATDGRRVKVTFLPKGAKARAQTAPQPVPADEHVLTVAQDGSGQFTSIGAALAKARRGMTIRVLDDAVYEESIRLSVEDVHAELTLEAPNHATLKAVRAGNVIVITVPGVRIRGFRFRAENVQTIFCVIGFHCAGTIVEDIECVVDPSQLTQGVSVEYAMNGPGEPPVIVRNNRLTGLYYGVRLRGVAQDYQTAEPSRGVMVVDNLLRDCYQAIEGEGDLRDVLIAGNRIVNARLLGVQLEQLLGQPDNIVVANNTLFQSQWPFRVWDDGVSKLRVSIVNNLSLDCTQPDWLFFDSGDSRDTPRGPGDTSELLKSWRFACNHREGHPPTENDLLSKSWIPPSDKDNLSPTIDVRSRSPKEDHFLRPIADSPLATAGLRDESLPLPPYVGALAPSPETEWDWMVTWHGMVDRD